MIPIVVFPSIFLTDAGGDADLGNFISFLGSGDGGGQVVEYKYQLPEPSIIKGKRGNTSISFGTAQTVAYNDGVNTGAAQAPAGKKLLSILSLVGSGINFEIYASNTLDVADGSLIFASTVNTGGNFPLIRLIIPSSKFLTIKNTSGAGSLTLANAVTVEYDNTVNL